MSTKSQLKQIKLLLTHIEKGGSVVRSALKRVIGDIGLSEFNKSWDAEKASRKFRPKEISEYAKRLQRGLALGTRAEKCYSNNTKTRRLVLKAKFELENAIEYLRDAVYANPNLRYYIDRDPFEAIDLCPETVPRPIWSTSFFKQRPFIDLGSAKKAIAIEILEKYENKLMKQPTTFNDFGFVSLEKMSKKLAYSDFSDFKF